MVVMADDVYEILKKSVPDDVLKTLSIHEDCVVPTWFQKDYFDETDLMSLDMWKRFSEYALKYNADNFSESIRECIDSFITFLKKINEAKADPLIQDYLTAYQKNKTQVNP